MALFNLTFELTGVFLKNGSVLLFIVEYVCMHACLCILFSVIIRFLNVTLNDRTSFV